MQLILLLLLILYQVVERLACVPKHTDEQAAGIWDYYVKKYYTPKIGYSEGYDYIPLAKKVQYGKWLITYVKEQKKLKVLKENFPHNFDLQWGWKGIGGEEGQLPPPWAYVKGGYVRPHFCYDRFVVGECSPKYLKNYFYVRYAYNSWTEKCEAFNYSGCGGNENRFFTKAQCSRACRDDKTCCDQKVYKGKPDYINI